MKKALQVILTICILAFAPVFMPGAFAMQAEPEILNPGGLRPVALTGEEQVFLVGDEDLWGAYWWDTSEYPACPGRWGAQEQASGELPEPASDEALPAALQEREN